MLGIVIGLCFVSCAGWILYRNRQLGRKGQRVTGTVVSYDSRRMMDGGDEFGMVYRPTVKFRTIDGRDIQTEIAIGSTRPPAGLGGQVPVIYDPDHPERARINTAVGRRRWVPVILGLPGLLILIQGVYSLR
jgi:hypothetical protein